MMVRLVCFQQKAEENFSVRRRKTKSGDTSKIREFDAIVTCREGSAERDEGDTEVRVRERSCGIREKW